jgi:hypothetical protein
MRLITLSAIASATSTTSPVATKPYGLYESPTDAYLSMEMKIQSDTHLDMTITLIGHFTHDGAYEERGSSGYYMMDVPYTFDPSTSEFILFPRGANYHDIARKLIEDAKKRLIVSTLPAVGRYDASTDIIYVSFGDVQLQAKTVTPKKSEPDMWMS